MLSSTRIVDKESWIGLTPILKNAHKLTIMEMGGYLVLCDECEADSLKGPLNHQRQVIHDEGSFHSNGQFFFALFKLPAIQALRFVPEVDAAMLQ